MKIDPPLHCHLTEGEGYCIAVDDNTGEATIVLMAGKVIVIDGHRRVTMHMLPPPGLPKHMV